MAEEPQPESVHEGASEGAPPSGTAEDRKAAAALSALDAHDDDAGKKNVDSKALEGAMKNLSVEEGKKAGEKKVVKVEASDVTLLVTELELSKAKATELLRAHDGDAVQAMGAFVTASA